MTVLEYPIPGGRPVGTCSSWRPLDALIVLVVVVEILLQRVALKRRAVNIRRCLGSSTRTDNTERLGRQMKERTVALAVFLHVLVLWLLWCRPQTVHPSYGIICTVFQYRDALFDALQLCWILASLARCVWPIVCLFVHPSVRNRCIVAKRQVIKGRRWYHRIGRWRLRIGCQ